MTLLTPKWSQHAPKWIKFWKFGKMIAIIKFFIDSKVLVQNFSILSQYLRVQSLIDTSDLHFALLGHKKCPNLLLGCFFPKNQPVAWFYVYISISNPSKTEHGLIFPKEPCLSAGLQCTPTQHFNVSIFQF